MHTASDSATDMRLGWPDGPRAVSLDDDEIHVWCAALHDFDEDLRDLRATLSSAERERAARFHFAADRDDFIVCRGLLRGLLGQYLHRQASTIEFEYGPAGKPELSASCPDRSVHFNVSHSGAIALFAASRLEHIGVDVEYLRPVPDLEQLASLVLSGREIADLAALPCDRRSAAFLERWTSKEAYVKATGKGLGTDLLADFSSDWRVHLLRPAANYVGALVHKQKHVRLSVWTLSAVPRYH
jgi:4'-phosphopantetheinyl transferase